MLPKEKPTGSAKPDLWGALLLFLFLSSLLFFLNRIGQHENRVLWGCLFISGISLILFIRVELHSPFPLVELSLLRQRLFISSLGASLFCFCASGAHAFVLPFFLQDILGFSPSKVGMLVFPVSLTVMVMAPAGGRISDRAGIRIPATSGLLLISLAIFSFTFLKGGTGNFPILLRQVLMGIGIGFFSPANNSAIIGSLPKERVGLASSFLALARNLGLVLGVALAGMVIAFKSTHSEGGGVEGSPALESIHAVWTLALLVGLVGGLLSWVRSEKVLHE
jgi:MFS family permease